MRKQANEGPDRLPGLSVAVCLASAVGIAYELTFMRVFSITQWYHFAYMIISIAMLGFGAGGTVLAMAAGRLEGRECALFRLSAFLLAISLPGSYALSQLIPFETFEVVSRPVQWGYLFLLYLVLSVPFFMVSVCVTLAFFLRRSRIGYVYFLNMSGSGAGAVGLTAAMYGVSPEGLVWVLTGASLLAFAATLPGTHHPRKLMIGLVLAGAASVLMLRVPLQISQYKGLSYALNYPDAEVKAEAFSPLSRLSAVASAYIRETPGQISHSAKTHSRLPEQVGLFFDAGAVSVINRFDGDLAPFRYLDYVTAALPYHLGNPGSVYVGGAGGGTDVLTALYHQSDRVTACEVDPNVFRMVNREFADFSGRLYEREAVRPVVADARGWLEAHPEVRFDLIHMALLDSFNASAAGVHALTESYLYTVEAVRCYLEHLGPRGMLSITRWLKTPPRDAVKMFATLVAGLEAAGVKHPGEHLFWVRCWNTATLVASKRPLREEQVAAGVRFFKGRGFDPCFYPGMAEEEANQHVVLSEPVYYRAATAILGAEREAFYRDFLYHVAPATDNQPYFFRFFKWGSIPRLVKGMGKAWVPFVEWGYLALVATILQGMAASAVLILLPLAVFRQSQWRKAQAGLLWVLLYFGLLGAGFMFLEIAFIQRVMRFLTYPVYAVAVVLTGFLLFSGLGSYAAWRLKHRAGGLVQVAGLGIALLSLLYIQATEGLFDLGAAWSDPVRITTSILLLAPLAFLMGIPFPLGLQKLADRRPGLLPWAWGINGCLSVVGAAVATLTGVHFGFTAMVLVAVAVYAAVTWVFRLLPKTEG